MEPARAAADQLGHLQAGRRAQRRYRRRREAGECIGQNFRLFRLKVGVLRQRVSGHTADCSLHWVVVGSGDASDSPGQVLFFDRKSPIGTATPDPRPYITVTAMGDDTAAVQYQWRQAQEPACCPTGIATVRFKIEDSKLKALDPIPNS